MVTRKIKGYHAEALVKEWYINKGWKCLEQNRTIRGGEIDLIMQSNTEICFVEVKAVHTIDDIHDYITPYKLRILSRTIAWYEHSLGFAGRNPRVDVVFVKNNNILHVFENCVLA